MRITRVQLRNIRGFRELDLPLGQPDRPQLRTVIIGRNGTCKSTLLRAIAVGLCDDSDANALLSEPIGDLVGHRADQADIRLWLSEDGRPQLQRLQALSRVENDKTAGKSMSVKQGREEAAKSLDQIVFLCGYGAGRSTVGTDSGRSHRTADTVRSLFDYQQDLIDPELTLRRLRDYFETDRYESILEGFKRALGLEPDDEIHLPPGGGIELTGPSVGGSVRWEGWADGYRVTFSWLLDLYARALRANRIDSDGRIDGIVLIDEVEQHLHPSMQRTVLPHLARLLPTTQLILTTHSPLVALAAEPTELVVLKRQRDEVYAEMHIPDFSGYSAEDMLTDERLFASKAHSEETEEKLDRYRSLAGKTPKTRSAGEEKELLGLAKEFRSVEPPAVRQDQMLQELERLLKRHDL